MVLLFFKKTLYNKIKDKIMQAKSNYWKINLILMYTFVINIFDKHNLNRIFLNYKVNNIHQVIAKRFTARARGGGSRNYETFN